MNWLVKQGDILDEPADVLVCSANIFLNLSGGVGGALLLRYGDAMQKELHRFLAEQNKPFVERGDIVKMPPCGSPYRAILHAVAVDGFYQSSPQIIQDVVTKCLIECASIGTRRIALTALATGYGRLSMGQFARGICPLISLKFPPVEEVVICVRNESDREALSVGLDLR